MPLQHFLDGALGRFIDLHSGGFGTLQLLDMTATHQVLVLQAHRGFAEPFVTAFARVDADQDCGCGRAFRERRTVVITDTERDRGFIPYRALARGAGFRAVISTPIVSAWGHLVGVVSAHFREPFAPAPLAVAVGEVFARGLASDILARITPAATAVGDAL